MAVIDDSILTQEQQEQFKNWLEVVNGAVDFACPVCKNDDWHIQPHFVSTPIFSLTRGMQLTGSSYPHVMVICSKCSNTMLFNAMQSGILKNKGKEEDKDVD